MLGVYVCVWGGGGGCVCVCMCTCVWVGACACVCVYMCVGRHSHHYSHTTGIQMLAIVTSYSTVSIVHVSDWEED